MLIDYDILITYGGIARRFEKSAVIFHEGTMPLYYYQVISGEVKLFSSNDEGKELLQGIFKTGQSFGEPPLLLNRAYPSTAQTNTESTIVKIRRQNFQEILNDYPELVNKLLNTFAERIYNKAVSAQIWVQQTPENKITQFLRKNKPACTDSRMQPVSYTRQQIADFTGLRVETVIRTLMRMKDQGIVKIVDHKLYY
ncbi:MAG: Crp/Fnr family transcriptional regulator [Chitinophagaceae bacterium]|nr:Crp/Fnr family transcriptional regulator [Chitinophagaceae bacterium]